MGRASGVARLALALLAGIALGSGSPTWADDTPDGAARPPNIVMVLADDMGWGDAGYNGAAFYETPHIDRLARQGMVFDRAYAGGSNCAPSRATLLTGTYSPRHGVYSSGGRSKGITQFMRLRVPTEDSSRRGIRHSDVLAPEFITIAEILAAAGYATARLGKWQLGPDLQGFELSSTNGQPGVVDPQHLFPRIGSRLTDAGARFIEANSERPFFLLLSHWDPHLPLKATGPVKEWYDAKLARTQGPWKPRYAAMIEAVDQSVGRLREVLQRLGLAEQTLFVFASDNGGVPTVTPSDPLFGGKGSFFEGGIRVPTCMAWPGVIAPRSSVDVPITGVDYLPTFAELAGAALPEHQPVDGRSIVPLLTGEGGFGRRAIFWFTPFYLAGDDDEPVLPIFGTEVRYWRGVPSAVIMKGSWKLVRYFEDDSIALYDLLGDRSESENLASREPERASRMLEELNGWLAETQAPIPTELNPDFLAPPAAVPGT